MMRRLPALLLAVLLLAACGTPPSKPEGADQPLKQVSLVLDWYPNAVHSFVLAAQEQGYFKEAGLDVTIKMPAENPTDGIKLVGAGKETFAFYYQPDVLLARAEQIPIVSVAAVVRHPLNGIIVPQDGSIKSPKDLEGQAVGYPGIPLNLPMVQTMVKTAGGDPATVKMTDISWDLVPALSAKKVPAIAGGFLNHERLVLERDGMKTTFFSPADWGVPNYYELVLIAGEQTVQKDRATVEAFWQALAKGQAWVKNHQEEAVKLLLAHQEKSFPLEADIEAKSLQLLLERMEDPGVAFGAQKAEDWEKVAEWMVEQGVLSPAVKPADAFVPLVK